MTGNGSSVAESPATQGGRLPGTQAVRPVASRFIRRIDEGRVTPGVVALVFGALLLSALVTQAIGVHALFGAFLPGAMIAHDSALASYFTRKLDDVATVLLLPAFFALTGMRTRIDLVSGWSEWLVCGAIVLVATAGKLGGAFHGHRLARRDSAWLLMNTRGLMELIALNYRAGPGHSVAHPVRHDGAYGPGDDAGYYSAFGAD
jgi:Kef-type K+ transport system membrane component KefB